MRRVLPAHVLLAAAVAGLELSNVERAVWPLAAALAVAALAVRPRLVGLAVLFAVAGWAWGSHRLDALDGSELRAQIGRAGVATAVVVGESRAGVFDQRQPAVVSAYAGRRLHERVQLELPLGRAPPQ